MCEIERQLQFPTGMNQVLDHVNSATAIFPRGKLSQFFKWEISHLGPKVCVEQKSVSEMQAICLKFFSPLDFE